MLKKVLFLLVLGLLLYYGFKRIAGPSETVTTYTNKLHTDLVRAKDVSKEDRLQEMLKAVRSFEASENRKPASLQELKDKDYIAAVPDDIAYDPQRGTVAFK